MAKRSHRFLVPLLARVDVAWTLLLDGILILAAVAFREFVVYYIVQWGGEDPAWVVRIVHWITDVGFVLGAALNMIDDVLSYGIAAIHRVRRAWQQNSKT